MIEIKFMIMVSCSIGMMAKFHPSMYVRNFIVDIDGGKIEGEDMGTFYAFRGVTYAKSPVGDLRFAPPQPYMERWEGIRDYSNYSEVCAQYDHFGYSYHGSEDCLKLNVFVPHSVARANRAAPVLVYVHGGAFMFGSSNLYGPDTLMKSQDMILVTINYRLGVLGFLSTEDEVIPGNFGLKDQVEALRWVQRNIENFNGNPDRVTITGFSAGGASVQLHYLSPLTDNLFNSGISHSGSALNPWVMMENGKQKAHQIASFVNCSQDHESLLACLRKQPAESLVMLAKKFQPFLYNPFSPFGVSVEPESESAFLTDHPLNLLEKGKVKNLPWLLSQTQDEGLYPASEFFDEEILKQINDNWNELAPSILDFDGTTTDEHEKLKISKAIRSFYLQDREITKENFKPFLKIITDRLYHNGAHRSLQLQSAKAPTFCYYFRFDIRTGNATTNNATRTQEVPVGESLGVSHGDDVFLIYDNLEDPTQQPHSTATLMMSHDLVNLYSVFASNENGLFDNLHMDRIKPRKIRFLEIFSPSNFSMMTMHDEFGQMNFWDGLNIQD